MILDCLKLITDRLKADATLVALVGGVDSISNHLPQDKPLPYLRYRLDSATSWDTKTSNGIEVRYIFDVWTPQYGDRNVLEIVDRIYALLHKAPFSGGDDQSLILRFEDLTVFPEGFVAHHGVASFRHVYTG